MELLQVERVSALVVRKYGAPAGRASSALVARKYGAPAGRASKRSSSEKVWRSSR